MVPRAMILAAGIGSRLQPLTDTTPKALLNFRAKTMLEHVISQLKMYGINEIIINVHHLADQIVDFVNSKKNFGIDIIFSDEREMLMDTGGGIMKARWFLEEKGSFLVHNIDIFSSIDLGALYEYHSKNKAIATLAVKQRITSRNLLIDEEGLLCGWRNNLTGSEIIVHKKPGLQALAFSGIHIIDPAIFEVLDREDPFPMTNAYLEIASEHRVMTYNHSGDSWIDMAHPNNFPELN